MIDAITRKLNKKKAGGATEWELGEYYVY
jgi:hypothetical protein